MAAPVFGALPVAVQPTHASWVETPSAIGEPATPAFVVTSFRIQFVPVGIGTP